MSLANLVKELREITGAGMMDCKKALEASNNDMDEAIKWLRENGISKAAKKGDRVAAEGLTKVVVKDNRAIIIELNSETDFVSKNEQFLELIDIIATNIVESDAKTLEEAMKVEKDGISIEQLVVEGTATIGEKITLRRFEIIEKSSDELFANYAHMGGRIGVLMAVKGQNLDTARQVCMHIAALNPQFITRDDVDQKVIEEERAILIKEALEEGKPENIVEKMVEGRIQKFLQEIVLLEQDYVVDGDKKVKDVLKEAGIDINNVVRFEVGEGIEKVEVDFAEEVAAQARV